MANPNALFGTIESIASDERGVILTLSGQRNARIEADTQRVVNYLRVLQDLMRRRRPVYLDVDAAGRIDRVLLPKIVRLQKIVERDGEIWVMFHGSQARHRVARDSEELRFLREAGDRWLAVTADDRGEILDVRAFDPQFDLPLDEPPPPLPWWCWLFRRGVSQERAQELFDLCAERVCDPLTVPPPCIPFNYPDDGCWARAHEMCRLMMAEGASPLKVWIDGWLVAQTKNNPHCQVTWGWHVAPTLCVRKSWFEKEEVVLDPSLFTTPVSKETWKSVQGDPNAVLSSSRSELFARTSGYYRDPTYGKTNEALADYRDALQLRSLGPDGPPPYAKC